MIIAHISDLHFGSHDPVVMEILFQHLIELKPDLVLASGDITQDATESEFADARDFFARLPMATFIIPGNHDLPGMDLSRFIDPWKRYRTHLGEELNPALRTPLVDIKGINTARMILPHWNWANGSISPHQRHTVRDFFEASTTPWRLLTLHHPLMSPSEFPLDITVFNAAKFLKTIDRARIDIVLAGHQHHAYVETRMTEGHTTLFISASTTTSTRIRLQPQGFNILHFTPDAVRIDQLRMTGQRFETYSALTHTKAKVKS